MKVAGTYVRLFEAFTQLNTGKGCSSNFPQDLKTCIIIIEEQGPRDS
jgi:hypothetical protein